MSEKNHSNIAQTISQTPPQTASQAVCSTSFQSPATQAGLSRRRFVQGVALSAATVALASHGAYGAENRLGTHPHHPPELTGNTFDLSIDELPVNFTGKRSRAMSVNGSVPGPTLRWREGETVRINVTNRMRVPTSVHWHSLRLPNAMDGVPGVTYRGIMPGETFHYEFPVRQNGTAWYHSHTRFQEQVGLSGAILIEPRGADPIQADREYVIFLSDWSDTNPETIFSNLKEDGDYYNYHRRTLPRFFAEAREQGLRHATGSWLKWARMNMSPMDIADVTGATYTYLLNGNNPATNWTALFKPGERLRLRFINGSAMTFFDVRIPGLKMTVVTADGNEVEPVSVDEFRIGVAERYDVIVEPEAGRAYTLFAQAEDRSGYARGTLAPHAGMQAEVPPMDPVPELTMRDMGMGMNTSNMASMVGIDGMTASDLPAHARLSMAGDCLGAKTGMGSSSSVSGAMSGMQEGIAGGMSGRMAGTMSGPASAPMAERMAAPMDQSAQKKHSSTCSMPSQMHSKKVKGGGTPQSSVLAALATLPGDAGKTPLPQPWLDTHPLITLPAQAVEQAEATLLPEHAVHLHIGPSVAEVAREVGSRLNDPGDGLRNNGRRVLTYADLRARFRGVDGRPPTREIELHLTGNMERYVWGFNGVGFAEAEPIRLHLGERVRFVLINDTMMAHPIHLHGLWSELENGQGEFRPYKDTITVKPAERLSYLVSADTPGRWVYHCHLLYHMQAGMFRIVEVTA